MICPPAPSFLNSSFVNVDVHRKKAGQVTVEIHPSMRLPGVSPTVRR
jgi:hypothetical protein